jgi:hypothetical protein
MILAAERTIEQRTLTSQFDNASDECSASSLLDQPNDFYPLMPLSTTISMFNVISFPEKYFVSSGVKRCAHGTWRLPLHEDQTHPRFAHLLFAELTVPIRRSSFASASSRPCRPGCSRSALVTNSSGWVENDFCMEKEYQVQSKQGIPELCRGLASCVWSVVENYAPNLNC